MKKQYIEPTMHMLIFDVETVTEEWEDDGAILSNMPDDGIEGDGWW